MDSEPGRNPRKRRLAKAGEMESLNQRLKGVMSWRGVKQTSKLQNQSSQPQHWQENSKAKLTAGIHQGVL